MTSINMEASAASASSPTNYSSLRYKEPSSYVSKPGDYYHRRLPISRYVSDNQQSAGGKEELDTLEPHQWKNRSALEEVKRRAGIPHKLLDLWIYKFLENKHFDVNETVAKLERRLTMERNELGKYDIDDAMRACMRAGVVRLLGNDKAGRTALYFVTKNDFPKSSERKMRTANFDMWLSYACRVRARDHRCGITMLINQKDASIWSNTDMTFQSNIAIRISKYYPNVIERAYVCNMGTALSAIARPILGAFPSAISDHIFVISESEVKNGKMLEYFDKSVLPKDLGGENDLAPPSDPKQKKAFTEFSDTVENYYYKLKKVISEGKSVKEWEMEQALEECRDIEKEERKKIAAQLQLEASLKLPSTEQQQQQQPPTASSAATAAAGGGGSLLHHHQHGGGARQYLTRQYLQQHHHQQRNNNNTEPSFEPERNDYEQKGNLGGDQEMKEKKNPSSAGEVIESSQQKQYQKKEGEAAGAAEGGGDRDDLYSVQSSKDEDFLYDEENDDEFFYDYDDDEEEEDEDVEESSEASPTTGANTSDNNQDGSNNNNTKQELRLERRRQRRLSRVQQRRLTLIQMRRLQRDETYFRSTITDLHVHQLNVLKNYQDDQRDLLLNGASPLYYSGSGNSEPHFLHSQKPDARHNDNNNDGNNDDDDGDDNINKNKNKKKNNESGSASSIPTRMLSPLLRSNQNVVSVIASTCPKSFRGFIAGFLVVLSTCFSAFFFLSTFFMIMGASSLLVMMFFYMYSSPGNIFPMGLAMLLIAHQISLVASRGFALSSSALKGELLPPLQWIAKKCCQNQVGWGLVFQFLLYFTIALAQFITFVIAAVDDPLVGLQQLFAIGLYACGILILIFHCFFPFGVTSPQEEAAATKTHGSRIGLTVYFFFDITETFTDEQDTHQISDDNQVITRQDGSRPGTIPLSSLVLALIPVFLSFVFGVGFIVEKSPFFLITAIVFTLGAGFTTTHFVAGRLKTLNANMSRSTIWVGVVVWTFCFFVFGLVPLGSDEDKWRACVIGLLVAFVLLVIFSSAANRLEEGTSLHRWMFRFSYFILIIATISGIVTLFIVHWLLGLFSMILMIHSVACFYRPTSHTPTAQLVVSLVVTLVLLAVILFATNTGAAARSDIAEVYFENATANGNVTLAQNQTTPFSSNFTASASQINYVSEFYALCQRVWQFPTSSSSSYSLRLPDLALFAKLSYSEDLSSAAVQKLLPTWTLSTHNFPIKTTEHNSGAIDHILFDVYSDNTVYNNSVVVVKSNSDFFSLIRVVSLWTESISLLPFVSILPTSWTASVVGGVSEVARLFDSFPETVISGLETEVRKLREDQLNKSASSSSSSSSTMPQLMLVGHSTAGSIAAAVASRLSLRAVTFSAPGLLYSQVKFNIDPTYYNRYVLNIRTSNDAVSVVDNEGPNQQALVCPSGTGVRTCSSIDFPLCLLSRQCVISGVGNITLSTCNY